MQRSGQSAHRAMTTGAAVGGGVRVTTTKAQMTTPKRNEIVKIQHRIAIHRYIVVDCRLSPVATLILRSTR